MLQHIGRTVVNISWRNDVVARHQALKDGRHCCQARPKCRTCLSTFECRHGRLECVAIGIVIARVQKTARITAIGVSLKGG